MTEGTPPHRPELWLVRHGETEWSRVRRHTGRSDLPLTGRGEAGATELAPRLRGVAFDLVLASPLRRAWRTAELAGLTPRPEPAAVEWDYGDYEGVTTAEIRETRPGWRVWRGSVPNGETIGEVAKRAETVIQRVREEARERAILVAHGHFCRILAMRWLGFPPEGGEHLRLGTATVSVLGWDRGVPIVERWNA
jgi:broad specificity phosphatase PhoE